MTIKDKYSSKAKSTFLKLLVAILVTLLIGVGLALFSGHLADLAGKAISHSMAEFLYGLGTVAFGFFTFVFFAATLGITGFTIFGFVNPDILDDGK